MRHEEYTSSSWKRCLLVLFIHHFSISEYRSILLDFFHVKTSARFNTTVCSRIFLSTLLRLPDCCKTSWPLGLLASLRGSNSILFRAGSLFLGQRTRMFYSGSVSHFSRISKVAVQGMNSNL